MSGLATAWRAEWAKALAARDWLTWGLGIFVTATGVSALMGSLILSLAADDVSGTMHGQYAAQSVYASPLVLCYLMALAVGINVYARERRQASLPMAMLITPKRIHVILAKYALGLALGAWYGVAYVAGVLIGGGGTLLAHGQVAILTVPVIRTLAVIISLLALWCFFGVGLGMCLSVMPALLTGFTLAFVFPAATSPLLSSSSWGRKIITLFPGVATNLSTDPEIGEFGVAWLPWWGSYAVLVLWVLITALLGARIVLNADIEVD